ncbi:bifunctional DNA primase/polymerase [Kribbella sp. WER1]
MHDPALARAEALLRQELDAQNVDGIMAAAAELDRHEPPPKRASVIGAALWYAARGLPVFPIQPGSKKPYFGSHGLDDGTTDPDAVRRMFADRPGCNLAIATGHRVDVIDFDGPESHAEWGKKYPTWESAGIDVLGIVSTPRPGGLHVYVPITGSGNYAGMLPGVDYRGRGGYVVVPPSVTAAGSYQWLRPLAEVAR